MLLILSFYVLLLNILNILKCNGVQFAFMNGTLISDQNYCEIHNCIFKCCPVGKIIKYVKGVDGKAYDKCRKIHKNVIEVVNYTRINLYTTNELKETSKNVESEFILVYDNEFFNESLRVGLEAKVLEDGSLKLKGETELRPKLRFCIDFLHARTTEGITAVFTYRIAKDPIDPQMVFKHIFVATGLLTSSFFMILVLVVYGLLPTIRGGLRGVILMTYLIAVIMNFVLKATQLIALCNMSIDRKGCQILSPVVYYTVLANFFWSNILSYHMYTNISKIKDPSTRLSRKPVGQLVGKDKKKYAYYSLYAWGAPAIITGFVILVDTQGWYPGIDTKPPFEDCFYNKIPVMVYLNLPIGLLTILNCILFVRTAYYIWAVDSGVINEYTKSTTKSRRRTYTLYMKISALMGVSWLLELIPSDIGLIPYIISSIYNISTGAVIFFVLLWRKKVLVQLFIKFNIMEEYVAKYKYKDTSSYEMESRRISSRNN